MTNGKLGIVVDAIAVAAISVVAIPIVLILMGYHVVTGK